MLLDGPVELLADAADGRLLGGREPGERQADAGVEAWGDRVQEERVARGVGFVLVGGVGQRVAEGGQVLRAMAGKHGVLSREHRLGAQGVAVLLELEPGLLAGADAGEGVGQDVGRPDLAEGGRQAESQRPQQVGRRSSRRRGDASRGTDAIRDFLRRGEARRSGQDQGERFRLEARVYVQLGPGHAADPVDQVAHGPQAPQRHPRLERTGGQVELSPFGHVRLFGPHLDPVDAVAAAAVVFALHQAIRGRIARRGLEVEIGIVAAVLPCDGDTELHGLGQPQVGLTELARQIAHVGVLVAAEAGTGRAGDDLERAARRQQLGEELPLALLRETRQGESLRADKSFPLGVIEAGAEEGEGVGGRHAQVRIGVRRVGVNDDHGRGADGGDGAERAPELSIGGRRLQDGLAYPREHGVLGQGNAVCRHSQGDACLGRLCGN